MANRQAKLFEAFQIGTKTLRNRIAVAPMTRVSGEEDGTVGRLMQEYYIHTTEPVLNDPAFEQSASLAALAKKYSGLPVIANGGVREPDLALSVIEHREADVITLGRTALANPDWPTAVRNDVPLKDFDYAILAPIANLESAKKYVELIE